jgi:hypothetical protein
MGKLRSSIAALIEVFLNDVLRLEGNPEGQVRESVRIFVADYERIFSVTRSKDRDRNLAASVCRALCRARVVEEMAKREGTPTAAHLKAVLSAIDRPTFSLKE